MSCRQTNIHLSEIPKVKIFSVQKRKPQTLSILSISSLLPNMDLFTSKHGLSALRPTQPMGHDDLRLLSPELIIELDKLEKLFTVDADKLKEIVQRFEEELQDGRLYRLANCSLQYTNSI